jgi:mono/diheme cytochrome c family protein
MRTANGRRAGWAASVVALGLLAGTTAAGQAAKPRRVDTALLYAKHCLQCHGEKGQGTPGVRPLDGDLAYGSEEADIAKVIREGIKDTTMAPFKDTLTEAQITTLAQYVRDLAKR